MKNDAELRAIFDSTKTIAAVGLSSNPARPSFGVCTYLKANGYRIIPVNPNETEVLGEKSYPDLKSVPVPVDLVQVFRKPEFASAIVDDAIAIGARTVWLQDGAGDDAAAAKAEAAGLASVSDDCMMRQHHRLYRT